MFSCLVKKKDSKSKSCIYHLISLLSNHQSGLIWPIFKYHMYPLTPLLWLCTSWLISWLTTVLCIYWWPRRLMWEHTVSCVMASVKRDMEKMSNWANKLKVTFESHKCKALTISRKRNPTSPWRSDLLFQSLETQTARERWAGNLMCHCCSPGLSTFATAQLELDRN